MNSRTVSFTIYTHPSGANVDFPTEGNWSRVHPCASSHAPWQAWKARRRTSHPCRLFLAFCVLPVFRPSLIPFIHPYHNSQKPILSDSLPAQRTVPTNRYRFYRSLLHTITLLINHHGALQHRSHGFRQSHA